MAFLSRVDSPNLTLVQARKKLTATKTQTATAVFASLACVCQSSPAEEATHLSRLNAVQITATRFMDPVQEVPLSISLITHDELVARGATDLRTALALIGGINVAPGGDAGPNSAVPGLLGLREVDDFLLLIDSIPAGNAFTPSFELVSLHNVERIEVLRGAAPVYFGTTAFAGTINIIHFPAGQADENVWLSYGSRGSATLRGAHVLAGAEIKQSLSWDLSRDRFADALAGVDRGEGRYRAAATIAGGQARLDFNTTVLRQKPASPTPVGENGQLVRDRPADFNQNPRDARLVTHRNQLVLGYDTMLALGQWGTTLSLTHSKLDSARGFLVEDYADAEGDNASGAVQSRRLSEVFIDTHITDQPTPWLALTYGFNALLGRASQDSRVFTYALALDGSARPDSASAATTGTATLADRRGFYGLYTQSKIRLSEAASLLAGVRWNQTRETRTSADAEGSLTQTQRNSRWSGSLGGQLRVWHDAEGGSDSVSVHASVGDTFQPAQIDFGPEDGGKPLLKAETQRSVEIGARADALDGRLDLDLSAFFVDFANQARTTEVAGIPTLTSGGAQRFKGIEAEASYRPAPALTLAAHASYNDARYRDFSTLIGDVPTQLAGKRLVMAPAVLAGISTTYAPSRGWRASFTLNHTGSRTLDALNQHSVGSYVVADASLGYAFDACTVQLSAANLGNRRDPVLLSELGEGQFYRLPARRYFVSVAVPLK